MRFIIGVFIIFLSSSSFAQNLLKNYDTAKPSHRMKCWTGQTGMKKYEIVGKQIVVDNVNKVRIQESQGNIFAGTLNTMFGKIILILDYDQKKVTQKSDFGDEFFDCS